MRPLEDPGGLLAELVEGLLHDALPRLVCLEVGHESPELVQELVDRTAVIAAHRQGETRVSKELGRRRAAP